MVLASFGHGAALAFLIAGNCVLAAGVRGTSRAFLAATASVSASHVNALLNAFVSVLAGGRRGALTGLATTPGAVDHLTGAGRLA